ncbi:hypothetical protein, partial [Streptomyces sp. KAI-27]|uniref:hypothetical protein n=1 Tax=Streptomyces sp. KAI-27 TaxID=1169748 RepID=UPI001C31B6BB
MLKASPRSSRARRSGFPGMGVFQRGRNIADKAPDHRALKGAAIGGFRAMSELAAVADRQGR